MEGHEEERMTSYGFWRSVFLHSTVLFLIVFVELFVMNGSFVIDGFHFQVFGYPWGTERVFAYSGIWYMPGSGPNSPAPNVYFLNYGELLILLLVLAVYSGTRVPETTRRSRMRWVFFPFFLAGFSSFLYFFVRIQVLQSFYYIGDVIYYPENSLYALMVTIRYYGLSPSAAVPFPGGVGGLSMFAGRTTYDGMLVASLLTSFIGFWIYSEFNQYLPSETPYPHGIRPEPRPTPALIPAEASRMIPFMMGDEVPSLVGSIFCLDGCTASFWTTTDGASGMKHTFDAVVSSRSGVRVAVMLGGGSIDPDAIMMFGSAADDCGFEYKCLFTPTRDEGTLALANALGIGILRPGGPVFGVEGIDKIIGSCVYGDVLLVSGERDDMRFLLSVSFLTEGCRKGERCKVLTGDAGYERMVMSLDPAFSSFVSGGMLEFISIDDMVLRMRSLASEDPRAVKDYIDLVSPYISHIASHADRLLIPDLTDIIVGEYDAVQAIIGSMKKLNTIALVLENVSGGGTSYYGLEEYFVSAVIKISRMGEYRWRVTSNKIGRVAYADLTIANNMVVPYEEVYDRMEVVRLYGRSEV